MSRRDPIVSVAQMREFASEAMEMANNRSRADLYVDRMFSLAMVRLMEVLGEAARRVPDEFRERYPAVPWRQTTNLRNVLIHEYDTVDFDLLWEVIKVNLPLLVRDLEAIIQENPRT